MVNSKQMSRKITMKQKKFAKRYIEHGNATLAVRESYAPTTYMTERNIASENLAKPTVREYIESHSEEAVSVVLSLMRGADNETVRLNSAKDVLDRAGFSPIEKNLTMNVNTKDLHEAIVKDLARFRGSTQP